MVGSGWQNRTSKESGMTKQAYNQNRERQLASLVMLNHEVVSETRSGF